jgi:hypothetical protein
MTPREKSLRWLVEKWLAPTPSVPVQVTRYSHPNSSGRCVLARQSGPARSLAIFFFRHEDGLWCVFPPSPKGPMMHAYPSSG